MAVVPPPPVLPDTYSSAQRNHVVEPCRHDRANPANDAAGGGRRVVAGSDNYAGVVGKKQRVG